MATAAHADQQDHERRGKALGGPRLLAGGNLGQVPGEDFQ